MPISITPAAPLLFVYTLRLPAKTSWEPHRAFQLMEQLLHTFDSLTFRIVASHKSIEWQVLNFSDANSTLMEQAIRTSYPDVEIIKEPEKPIDTPFPHYRVLLRYEQAAEFVMPIQYVTEIKDADPLVSITHAMSDLQPGEYILYTLFVVGAATYAYKEGERLITQSTIHPLQLLSTQGMADAAFKKVSGLDRTEKYAPELQHMMEEKLQQRLYQASMFIELNAPLKERLVPLCMVDGQLVHFTRYPYNAIVCQEPMREEQIVVVDTDAQEMDTNTLSLIGRWVTEAPSSRVERRIRETSRLVLEPRELAALWHLPHSGCTAPEISWLSAHQVTMPAVVLGQTEGVCLGEGRYSGRYERVFLKPQDRVAHMNVVGKTGVGKSTFLHQLIHQDIAQGHGVAVIDPHGSLIRNILQRSIPTEREGDVVVLDFAEADYPPPLNPLRGRLSAVASGQILSIIERLFPDTIQYARLSRYLRAALDLLQGDAEATMRDVGRVFVDEAYRTRLLDECANDEVLFTWNEYEAMKEGEQRQIREPILSRISPFYSNPDLLPILSHPDTLDFRKYIQQKKIILVSLKMDEEHVPEQERNLVGSLLISRLQLSGMQGTSATYYLYIDEVQKFITTSLDEMLSEARKFGLSLTIAHQFLSQLSHQTLEAVMGNVGATVMFQGSPSDAHVFAPYVKPEFQPEDLVNLDKFQAAVKMQYESRTQPAFFLKMMEPLARPSDALEREERIRKRSAAQYTPKSRADVTAWLKARYPRPQRKSNVSDEETFYENK